MHQPERPASGRNLWLFVAGFALAALLTLGAAVGTSMLQQHSEEANSPEAPIAQN